jgi:hypothetical protein
MKCSANQYSYMTVFCGPHFLPYIWWLKESRCFISRNFYCIYQRVQRYSFIIEYKPVIFARREIRVISRCPLNAFTFRSKFMRISLNIFPKINFAQSTAKYFRSIILEKDNKIIVLFKDNEIYIYLFLTRIRFRIYEELSSRIPSANIFAFKILTKYNRNINLDKSDLLKLF